MRGRDGRGGSPGRGPSAQRLRSERELVSCRATGATDWGTGVGPRTAGGWEGTGAQLSWKAEPGFGQVRRACLPLLPRPSQS